MGQPYYSWLKNNNKKSCPSGVFPPPHSKVAKLQTLHYQERKKYISVLNTFAFFHFNWQLNECFFSYNTNKLADHLDEKGKVKPTPQIRCLVAMIYNSVSVWEWGASLVSIIYPNLHLANMEATAWNLEKTIVMFHVDCISVYNICDLITAPISLSNYTVKWKEIILRPNKTTMTSICL